MGENCSQCQPATLHKRDRWLVFTDTMDRVRPSWVFADFIVLQDECGPSRHGRARIVCACSEYGSAALGAGTVVVWGRNTSSLVEAFQDAPAGAKTVIVALTPGTHQSGRSLKKIETLCEAQGRDMHTISFEAGQGCYVDPNRTPRLTWAKPKPGVP